MSSESNSFYYGSSGSKYSEDWRSTISSLLKQTERNLEKNPALPIPIRKAPTVQSGSITRISQSEFTPDKRVYERKEQYVPDVVMRNTESMLMKDGRPTKTEPRVDKRNGTA